MGTSALVSLDIENGAKVLEALDKAGLTPNVALWAKLPDYEDWRLIIASEFLDPSSLRAGYSAINDAIDKAGIPIHRQPTILLRPIDSPMIKELRRMFAATKDTYGMRLGGQSFGDKFFEDAVVYRIK